MKRVMLALLGLMCAFNLAAQNRQARIQQVMAIQEIRAEGLSAAHPTLPVGSKVRIRNPANALTIEATIVEQLSDRNQQVIDISPAAALALDIGAGGPVIVTTLSQAQPVSSNTRQNPDADETDTDKSSLPFNITINNYVTNPAEDSQNRQIRVNSPQDAEIAPDISGQSGGAPVTAGEPPAQPQVVAQPPVVTAELPVQPPVVTAELPVQPPVQVAVQPPVPQPPIQPAVRPEAPLPNGSLYTSPPVHNIQIIPSTLPDPHSKKVYRLLVGTYLGVDSAFRVYRQLDRAGFKADMEQVGDMCRVFAAGIPAAQVYYAAQRLGAIGFEQVWIQE